MSRLLVIAPTCDRDDVGEAWVAHQWAARLSRRHDTTVLTYRKRGRPPIAAQLPHARVVEWVEPPLLGRAERLNSLLKPGYVAFHLRARRWIREALAAGERFDIAHQPTPVAMRYPSPLAGSGIPYVLGPVGGGLDSPPGFDAEDTAPWYVGLRRLDRLRLRHDPMLRRTYGGAACVLGIADYVAASLAPIALRRLEIMSETGIEALPPAVDRNARRGPVRLLFVGRLVRTKGARDAIRALALLGERRVELDVVGDGFDRAVCERLAADLGVADRVRFHGWQPRVRVAQFYAAADIFVFPSFREPGGNVAFEAMASGLPLVVNDRGGPAAAVDDGCGRRVTAHDPDRYAADLAAALAELVDDPPLRRALGDNARRRVAETALWDRKLDRIDALYAEVLTGRCQSDTGAPLSSHTLPAKLFPGPDGSNAVTGP